MDCNMVRDNLSLYMDNELDEEEKALLEEHINACPECKKELEDYKKIQDVLRQLPDEELPVGYCKRLHNLLKAETNNEAPKLEDNQQTKVVSIIKKNKFRWVKYGSLAAALALIVIVSGLNGGLMMKSTNESGYDSYNMTESAQAPAEAPAAYPQTATEDAKGMADQNYLMTAGMDKSKTENRGDAVAGLTTSLMAEREMKIIKSGRLYVQTKDYDTFLKDINTKLVEVGGFIENNYSEVYQVYEEEKLMHGNLKIRVPQESFYDTVSFLEQTTDVTSKNISEEDVTKDYYEKDNKVKNLEVQEQHLRDLFQKAATVEEMLLIENELRRVRTEIDELNISLSDINDRASMSTINLEVEEVRKINFTLKSEKGVLERSKEGFIGTINLIVRGIGNFVVSLVSSSPILIPLIIIFAVLLLNVKKYWKKKL